MSSFTSELVISPVGDRKWEIIEPFRYRTEHFDSPEKVITIPTGFVTDFASIPRIFWVILPPWGRYGKAAVLHDFLYRSKLLSKRDSDLLFLDAMDVLKVNVVTKTTLYLGVKFFGIFAWNRYLNKGE